jgi:hypothetical protein
MQCNQFWEGRIDMEKYTDFSSVRFITTLTPDTFLRKMIIISTLFSKAQNEGETAIKQEGALNSCNCDYNTGFKKIKTHTDLNEAINFHINLSLKQRFTDCEQEHAK